MENNHTRHDYTPGFCFSSYYSNLLYRLVRHIAVIAVLVRSTRLFASLRPEYLRANTNIFKLALWGANR